jgi:UDP-N-acetylglucosamine:LPS N-acetylglucosamine transferase
LTVRRGILIVSASMGAGHHGAAYELERRLTDRGHDVHVVDFLSMLPFGIGRWLRWSYRFQLNRLPSTYDASYRMFSRRLGRLIRRPLARVTGWFCRRAFARVLRETRPDAVVSTYWLASLVLGLMRKQRALRVPVASYLCDFGVHPLWVHPGVDLNLTVSPGSAAAADALGSKRTIAAGPLVSERFSTAADAREEIRAHLGITDDERAVLVVAGSWGVGDVPDTVAAIRRCGAKYHPITVCGHDTRLEQTLIERGVPGSVIGWTDQMPALMAAADATVENAGGLTAMEAFAAGLPVITFHPIAGHGKDNAGCMSRSGVSRYAHDEYELARDLAEATTPGPARDALIDGGRALFASDPADEALALAAHTPAHALLTPLRARPARRRVAFAVMSLFGLYFALTVGAHGVAALGVGVAKPPEDAANTVYLGVRVNSDELYSAEVANAIEGAQATVVVSGRVARHSGTRLQDLANADIDLANGGWGNSSFLRWDRARNDCDKSWRVIADTSGQEVREFVPGRSLDAFDQLYCRTGEDKQRLIRPDVTYRPGARPTLKELDIYLLDGRGRDPEELAAAIADFAARAKFLGMEIQPLRELR